MTVRFGVVLFPGTNCEHDVVRAVELAGGSAEIVWHAERRVGSVDGLILPGGFAHGDYLRPGAIARFSPLMTAVEEHDAITIAAVNGYALGGGCELALACDLRIAAENAVFGLPEPSLGIIPGAGGTQRLPRIVGLGRAKEMILTGARWDARKALAFGLVSEVVLPTELLGAARAMAHKVLALGPLATRLAKTALNASAQTPLRAGLLLESVAQAITFESADKDEGTAAFLEKRKPAFKED